VIDTGFDWMWAPLVWLLLVAGMLVTMKAGVRACRASPSLLAHLASVSPFSSPVRGRIGQ
jgi:hypothetical protein